MATKSSTSVSSKFDTQLAVDTFTRILTEFDIFTVVIKVWENLSVNFRIKLRSSSEDDKGYSIVFDDRIKYNDNTCRLALNIVEILLMGPCNSNMSNICTIKEKIFKFTCTYEDLMNAAKSVRVKNSRIIKFIITGLYNLPFEDDHEESAFLETFEYVITEYKKINIFYEAFEDYFNRVDILDVDSISDYVKTKVVSVMCEVATHKSKV
jgi:hypothetical protein